MLNVTLRYIVEDRLDSYQRYWFIFAFGSVAQTPHYTGAIWTFLDFGGLCLLIELIPTNVTPLA